MFQPPLRAIGLLLIASCALAGQQLCIMIKVGQGSRRDLQTTRLPIYNELASLFGRLDNPNLPIPNYDLKFADGLAHASRARLSYPNRHTYHSSLFACAREDGKHPVFAYTLSTYFACLPTIMRNGCWCASPSPYLWFSRCTQHHTPMVQQVHTAGARSSTHLWFSRCTQQHTLQSSGWKRGDMKWCARRMQCSFFRQCGH